MWHLFDYYLQIGGSGFGAKKACAAPVHLLYSYPSEKAKGHDNDSNGYVWVVNSLYTAVASGMTADATVYGLDGSVQHTQKQPLAEVPADSSARLFPLNLYPPTSAPSGDCVQVQGTDTVEDQYQVIHVASVQACCELCDKDAKCTHSIHGTDDDGNCYMKNMKQNDHGNTMTPVISPDRTLCLKRGLKTDADATATAPRTQTVLLRLRLMDASGKVAEDNWYWLPPKLDVFEDPSSCFTGCQIETFADMRDLASMPTAPKLTVSLGQPAAVGGAASRTVTLSAAAGAKGDWLAFFVRLRALGKDGTDILPASWSDNFVTVLAGQSVDVVLGLEAGAEAVASVVAEAFNA